jgi:hypothetical protein
MRGARDEIRVPTATGAFFAAARWDAIGTSRQFAAQHKLGSDWRRSGHVATPASYQSDATDPRRTTDRFPRALWMIASAGHRYCLHREVRRSATGQRGRKCYTLQTSGAEDRWRTMNPLRTTVLMKTDISGSTSRFHELLAADLQALLGEHRDFLARHAAKHEGHIIKAAGDGHWLEFRGVTGAAKAAIEMQEELRLAQILPFRMVISSAMPLPSPPVWRT